MRLLTNGKEEPDEAFPELTSENWLAAFLSDLQVRRDESAKRFEEEQRRKKEAPPEPVIATRGRRGRPRTPIENLERFFEPPLSDWDREFLERLRSRRHPEE